MDDVGRVVRHDEQKMEKKLHSYEHLAGQGNCFALYGPPCASVQQFNRVHAARSFNFFSRQRERGGGCCFALLPMVPVALISLVTPGQEPYASRPFYLIFVLPILLPLSPCMPTRTIPGSGIGGGFTARTGLTTHRCRPSQRATVQPGRHPALSPTSSTRNQHLRQPTRERRPAGAAAPRQFDEEGRRPCRRSRRGRDQRARRGRRNQQRRCAAEGVLHQRRVVPTPQTRHGSHTVLVYLYTATSSGLTVV